MSDEDCRANTMNRAIVHSAVFNFEFALAMIAHVNNARGTNPRRNINESVHGRKPHIFLHTARCALAVSRRDDRIIILSERIKMFKQPHLTGRVFRFVRFRTIG